MISKQQWQRWRVPSIVAHAPRLVWHILLPLLVWLAPRHLIPDPMVYVHAGITLTLVAEAYAWLLGFDPGAPATGRFVVLNRRGILLALFSVYLALALGYFAWSLRHGQVRDSVYAYAVTLIILDCAYRAWLLARREREGRQPALSGAREPGIGIIDLYTPRVLAYITLFFVSAYYPLNVHLLVGYVVGAVTGLVGMRGFIRKAGVRFLKTSPTSNAGIVASGRRQVLAVAVVGLLLPLVIGLFTQYMGLVVYGQAMVLGAIEFRLWQGEILALANDAAPHCLDGQRG